MAKKPKTAERLEKERREQLRKNRSINQAIKNAKGTELNVSGSVPEASKKMGDFIRGGNGSTSTENKETALFRKKVAAVAEGYILGDDGEILHDVREGA